MGAQAGQALWIFASRPISKDCTKPPHSKTFSLPQIRPAFHPLRTSLYLLLYPGRSASFNSRGFSWAHGFNAASQEPADIISMEPNGLFGYLLQARIFLILPPVSLRNFWRLPIDGSITKKRQGIPLDTSDWHTRMTTRKEGRRTVLLLGFEDDEKGAGFADNTEENGLTGLHIL